MATELNNKDNQFVVGFDLGTTYSCVAVWKDGRSQIIPNEQGFRTTPSYVAFNSTSRLIGQDAKDQCVQNPHNTIYDVKRLIGRKFDDVTVQEDMKNWSFKVSKNAKKQPLILATHKGTERQFYPEEISAMILHKLKLTAEAFLSQTVTDAVITVPAYFNDAQRTATKDAAKIAGLNCIRILNEPTAAALSYGLDKKCTAEQKILIIDLGGGTLDCSLLEIEAGTFEVIATAGDPHLGGEDFDNLLVNFLCQEFTKTHRLNIKENAKALRKLRNACEKAKIALSSSAQAEITIEALHKGVDFNYKITRQQFEELCLPLFRKCFEPIKKVMVDAKIKKNQIDEIVVVGGSTRIPKIQDMIKEFFNGKELNRSAHPDEAIACGAAIQGAILSRVKQPQTQDMTLLDVAPLSLGVETAGGVMNVIIERNTKIPCKKIDYFTTYADNQNAVTINIYEGERPMTKDNNFLGQFDLLNIPQAPRHVPQIEVSFEIDHNGILNVSAIDAGSQNGNQIQVVKNKDRLSQSQIDKLVADAEKYREEDYKVKARVEVRNGLESLMYQIRTTLSDPEIEKNITEDERNRILGATGNVRKWLDENLDATMEEYEYYQSNLEHMSQTIFTRIYTNIPKLDPNDLNYMD
jgi:heat shock protein 1/8